MAKFPDIVVNLSDGDGNAMSIIAKVVRGLRRGGVPESEIVAFRKEAKSGDYDHVIQTAMAWVEVE